MSTPMFSTTPPRPPPARSPSSPSPKRPSSPQLTLEPRQNPRKLDSDQLREILKPYSYPPLLLRSSTRTSPPVTRNTWGPTTSPMTFCTVPLLLTPPYRMEPAHQFLYLSEGPAFPNPNMVNPQSFPATFVNLPDFQTTISPRKTIFPGSARRVFRYSQHMGPTDTTTLPRNHHSVPKLK